VARKAVGVPRKKPQHQHGQQSWETWVEPATLELLNNSSSWTAVTKGLTELKRQFDGDPSQPSAVVIGVSSLFIGKTFTTKVMSQIMAGLLSCMRPDQEKLSDDAVTCATQFAVDKLQDKRFEPPFLRYWISFAKRIPPSSSSKFYMRI
jgi:hypothetical protein